MNSGITVRCNGPRYGNKFCTKAELIRARIQASPDENGSVVENLRGTITGIFR
jgi:hypothetical protein